jgi:hypothetical protein
MQSKPIIDIIEQLDDLNVGEDAKRLFLALVLNVSAAYGIHKVDRIEQVAYVCRLLDLHVSRPTIRDRLIAFHSVSRRQAYRLIDDALKLCQKRARIGTVKEEDAVIEIHKGV